jgi:nucleotide-binding universal stress UspA family protein
MIKDVVVNLEHLASRDPARDFAISVAVTFDAHVAGVAFAYDPDFLVAIAPEMPPDVTSQIVDESEKSALAAIDRFDEAARRSMVSAEHRLIKSTWIAAPDVLSDLARRFDVSVFMQSDQDNGIDNDDMIETALFDSGRPVMVVPYIQKDGLKLDHLVCCWDGSRAAARAINDALPLLEKASAVDLLIVLNEKTRSGQNEVRGAEMARHLARHNVKVGIESIPAADVDVTNTILSYVADNSGTLIVMGGYGHARLRELILGGVTHDMLESMTVPVFMSH